MVCWSTVIKTYLPGWDLLSAPDSIIEIEGPVLGSEPHPVITTRGAKLRSCRGLNRMAFHRDVLKKYFKIFFVPIKAGLGHFNSP